MHCQSRRCIRRCDRRPPFPLTGQGWITWPEGAHTGSAQGSDRDPGTMMAAAVSLQRVQPSLGSV